jgi:hypothetical protein
MHKGKDWKCCEKYDETYKVIVMPLEFKHHSKAVCAYCEHFMKWLPNPKTIQEQEERQRKVKRLMECTNLSEYDQHFLKDMSTHIKMTPKQVAYLEKLYDLKFQN